MLHFTIPADHPSLPGHFPGRPLVPGVVVLERVIEAVEAQALATGHAPLTALRLPQVKFIQPLLPAQQARIELEACPDSSGAPRWRFRVWRDDVLVASGEVVADEAAATSAATSAAKTSLTGAAP